ncbi:hypothetical protein [Devosia sp. Leaf64]|uniref:hypothetical protein n=1 Tax=Devosia sp. Leaf64 TaxID=1736229 RepID=UPI000712D809|nr:hypothetical protein [Devosia sp. Leaf64]KQN70094.1 hypothetical protein ASE94_13565 [Devosia sp. Leaf64]
MRKTWIALGLTLLSAPAFASETGDAIVSAAYEGKLSEGRQVFANICATGDTEACFGAGLGELVFAYESLAQAMYRHGGVAPGNTPAALIFGLGVEGPTQPKPANPKPEPLTYDQFRGYLDATVASLDTARGYFEKAGETGDYVILLDPLRLRFDIDGDGTVGETETLSGPALEAFGMYGMLPVEEGHKTKDKTGSAAPDTSVGLDRADAFWLAGYTQVVASPVDWLMAHDFTEFYNAYFHRFFPEAGLPMQAYNRGGILFLDGDSDTGIADMVAALHTLSFPVSDSARLAGVLDRLKSIPALSRKNWDAILAETDDTRELLPSPSQTSIFPDMNITEEMVAAWRETLDGVDKVFAGELLLPHWRFKQGFDLAAYFNTATETDIVMMFIGQGALPYIKPGPIADAESFAAANRVFGENWPLFALWFN